MLLQQCDEWALWVICIQTGQSDLCARECSNLAPDLIVALAAEPQGVRPAFCNHATQLNQRKKGIRAGADQALSPMCSRLAPWHGLFLRGVAAYLDCTSLLARLA